MKKKLTIILASMLMLMIGAFITGCGEKEEEIRLLDASVFRYFDETINDSYEVVVEVRNESAVDAQNSLHYIVTNSVSTNQAVTYGTYGGGDAWQAHQKEGETITYLNYDIYNGVFTADEYILPFNEYDAVLSSALTAENMSDAPAVGMVMLTLDKSIRQWGDGGIKVIANESVASPCMQYEKNLDNLINSIDESGKYTHLTADLYVTEENELLYAILTLFDDGHNNKTITLSKSGSTVSVDYEGVELTALADYELMVQGIGVSKNGETALDMVGITDEDIDAQNIDGYYFADGFYSKTNPSYEVSWIYKENGETIWEFNFEENTFTDYTTGETKNDYVTYQTIGDRIYATVEDDKSHYADEINTTDVFSLTFAQINSGIVGYDSSYYYDWQYLTGYNYSRYPELKEDRHKDAIPKDIRDMIEDIYNNWTLQDVIDKVKSNGLSEEEKIYISYLALNEDFTVQRLEKTTVLFSELMVELGLPVYEYAIRKDELWVSVETYLGL